METMNDEELIRLMARTFWALAWADWADTQNDISMAGQEIMDIMPPVPDRALWAAYRYAGMVEQANGASLVVIMARNPECKEHMDEFAYYLVMQALGHGVAWSDRYDSTFPVDVIVRLDSDDFFECRPEEDI